MRFNTLLISIIFIFFTGCVGDKPITIKQKELPQWFKNPPKSNQTTLYSTGEGENRQEAINDALSLMTSTMSVSISSNFTSHTVTHNDLITQDTISDITSNVKKIRISTYKILKSEEFSYGRYLVLISSDKQELFKSLKDEVEQKLSLIDKKQQYSSIIEKLHNYKNAITALKAIPYTLLVMHELNGNFNQQSYLAKISNIKKRYQKAKSSTIWSIQTNNDAKALRYAIANALTKQQFNITKQPSKAKLKVFVKSKTKKTTAYGFMLANSYIDIVVKDRYGKILGSNTFKLVGHSATNYNLAKHEVVLKLKKKIEQEGIYNILGVSL
jgi:hypothetical protein